MSEARTLYVDATPPNEFSPRGVWVSDLVEMGLLVPATVDDLDIEAAYERAVALGYHISAFALGAILHAALGVSEPKNGRCDYCQHPVDHHAHSKGRCLLDCGCKAVTGVSDE